MASQHRQRCTKHNALIHDFFVSYRVSTDKINAEKLAAHIDGRRRPDGNNFVTYLDKNCLIQGMDWEEGFTYGIRNSKVLLLLISQGTIATMIGKAKRNEVDNVLKEHKEALKLCEVESRTVVPICVASLGTNKSNRDCYFKLDTEAALRQFDLEGENVPADVQLRLQDIKQVLAKLFVLPIVNIEPDSIAEQVPKIIQLWYSRSKKTKDLKTWVTDAKKSLTKPSWYNRWFRYPSQSFRLTFVGSLIGFFGMFVTLSLLFMQSKSKSHTDLKLGVALGNILAFTVVILICIGYCAKLFYGSSNIYCTSCESVVVDYSDASYKYFGKIPDIVKFLDNCQACYEDTFDASNCLACLCSWVYKSCEFSYALSVTLLVIIALQALMIFGTAVVVTKFTKNESFAMSLQ